MPIFIHFFIKEPSVISSDIDVLSMFSKVKEYDKVEGSVPQPKSLEVPSLGSPKGNTTLVMIVSVEVGG